MQPIIKCKIGEKNVYIEIYKLLLTWIKSDDQCEFNTYGELWMYVQMHENKTKEL